MYPWQWCSIDILWCFWLKIITSLQRFWFQDYLLIMSCQNENLIGIHLPRSKRTPFYSLHLPMQNLHFTNYSKNVSCDINFRRKRCYHYKWVGVWGFISWRSGVISDSLRTSVWQTALQRQWGAVSRRRVYTTRYSQQANKVYMISCCWETVKWWKLSCPQHGESSSGVNQMLVWYTWLMTWDFMVFAQESHF